VPKSGPAARIEDVHALASGMPHVTVERGSNGNPVYQVGGKSFVFFRNPRPDAIDPETRDRYPDVVVFWVVRASRIGEITRDELAEIVQDAWLSRASARRAADWLRSTTEEPG